MNRIYHMLMAVALFLCAACSQSRDTVAVRDSGTTFAQEALRQYVDSGRLPGAISVLYRVCRVMFSF